MMFVLVVLCLSVISGSLAQYEPDCVCLEQLQSTIGIRMPTVFRSPPDGSSRRMVAEQRGVVWIVRSDGSMDTTPFLNITQSVLAGGERGFLSFGFHPQFVTNNKLYLYYSTSISGQEYTRLSEIQASATNPDQVDYATERTLLEIEQPFTNHNGGDILFGADNLLYLTIGDGGSSGDPFDNAQNKSTLLGSIIRIDPDTRTGNLEYGIPADNPYLSDPLARPELYAIGLRNAWRISMDAGDRNTGDGFARIFMGDVGQNAWEEVDILQAGGNYGWAGREAMTCYKAQLCGNTEPEVFPVAYYSHADVGQCIIGGVVYRGCMNPNFNGWYFFADYSTHKLFRMIEDSPDVWSWKEIFTCSTCPGNLVNVFGRDVLFFGTDYEGELYFGTTDAYSPTIQAGNVYKIVDPNNTQPTCPATR